MFAPGHGADPVRMEDLMTGRPTRTLSLLITALAALAAAARLAHAADAPAPPMVTVNPYAVEFIEIPDMPKCATATILQGDPRTGPAWVLLKLGSGCLVPWHWHTANENLVVIHGEGRFEMRDGPPLDFVPGAYASLPSEHVHRAICVRECLLFNTADAAYDIHYVDPSGEEISLDEALAPAKKAAKAK